MKIDEFLSRISFRDDTWDDYGYEQTAVLTFTEDSGEISHFIKIYPNTEDNFRRIKDNRIEKVGNIFCLVNLKNTINSYLIP